MKPQFLMSNYQNKMIGHWDLWALSIHLLG